MHHFWWNWRKVKFEDFSSTIERVCVGTQFNISAGIAFLVSSFSAEEELEFHLGLFSCLLKDFLFGHSWWPTRLCVKPEIISIPREEEGLRWPPLRWWQSWFLPLDWWSIFIINLLNHLHSLKGERDTQWSPWMGYCQRVGGGGDLHRMRYFWP